MRLRVASVMLRLEVGLMRRSWKRRSCWGAVMGLVNGEPVLCVIWGRAGGSWPG